MNRKTILTAKVIDNLWNGEIFEKGADEDEWFLDSCLRYGNIVEMAEAGEKAMQALFYDNGIADTQRIFNWMEEMINNPEVFPWMRNMSEVVPLARKAFDKEIATYRREGWLPMDYDVNYAFCGFMGLVNKIVHDRFYEKYDRIQSMGSDAFYKMKGLFRKSYTITALSQFDDFCLNEVPHEDRYNRFDSIAILMYAEEKSGMECRHDDFMRMYAEIKDVILNATGTLSDMKKILEAKATNGKEREMFALLFAAGVLEYVYG